MAQVRRLLEAKKKSYLEHQKRKIKRNMDMNQMRKFLRKVETLRKGERVGEIKAVQNVNVRLSKDERITFKSY